MKLEFSQHIFGKKPPNMKFCESLSRVSQVDPSGHKLLRTDRQTDRHDTANNATCNFVNVPKK